MNCKPGDLAMVVHSPDPRGMWALGLIVEVVSSFSLNGRDYWYIKDPVLTPYGYVAECAEDWILLPLRGLPEAEKKIDEVTA